MMQPAGSTIHVVAAGLSLAAGYAAAAYAAPSREQADALRGPVIFGEISSPRADDSRVAVLHVGADTTPVLRGPMPRAIVWSKGPPGRGAIPDAVSRNGVQVASLAWASVPAVPKPVATTEAVDLPIEGRGGSRGAAVDAKIEGAEAAMPVMRTLAERMGVEGIGAALLDQSPLFGVRRKRSEPGRLPISRSHALDHTYSHAGDPLAVLEIEDAQAPEFIMPFANGRITSLFNQGRIHPAIDLAGKLGSPVLATTSGQKVTFAGSRGGYGNAVITVDVYGRTHLYGHLQRITSRVGQMLDQGDKLGHLGSTGHSTGPHVHYEVRNRKGTHINPVTLLFPGRGVAKGYAWLDVRQESVLARVAARSR